MPRLLRAMGRTAVVAGTATAVSNRVSRRQANRWSQQQPQPEPQQQYYEEPVQYAPPPAAAPTMSQPRPNGIAAIIARKKRMTA